MQMMTRLLLSLPKSHNIPSNEIKIINRHTNDLVDAFKNIVNKMEPHQRMAVVENVVNQNNALGKVLAGPTSFLEFFSSKPRTPSEAMQKMNEFKNELSSRTVYRSPIFTVATKKHSR